MFVKIPTHKHMMLYTLWCWHIYKGDEVGEEKEKKSVSFGCPKVGKCN
jgi:hypothetical protein